MPSRQKRRDFRDEMKPFPKIIHQIWFQGGDALPDKYLANIATIYMLNPGWTHMLWDDQSLQKECSAVGGKCLQTYLAFEHMHQKIDFGRYVVLYRYGGTSVDIDMMCLKPFDDLAKVTGERLSAFDVAVSFAPASKFEAKIAMMGTGLDYMYNNAWILAKPRTKVMLWLIHRIIEFIFERPRCGGVTKNSYQCIMQSTGPVAFTKALTGQSKLIILDKKYFESCVGWEKDCKPHELAFVFHQHDNTWIPNLNKKLFQLWFRFTHDVKGDQDAEASE